MREKEWKDKVDIVVSQSKIFEKELEEEKKKVVLLTADKI